METHALRGDVAAVPGIGVRRERAIGDLSCLLVGHAKPWGGFARRTAKATGPHGRWRAPGFPVIVGPVDPETLKTIPIRDLVAIRAVQCNKGC